MMETKDLQQLRDLLMKWGDALLEGSDTWSYCMCVLIDLNRELLNRQYGKAVSSH